MSWHQRETGPGAPGEAPAITASCDIDDSMWPWEDLKKTMDRRTPKMPRPDFAFFIKHCAMMLGYGTSPPLLSQTFYTYRRAARGERNAHSGDIAPAELARRQYVRQRPTKKLVGWFWRLLRQERRSLALTLLALAVATILTLIPPAATKVVFDNVLGDQPLPSWSIDALPFIAQPGWLLACLAAGSLLIAIVGLSIGMWTRWRATRTTKRLQVRVRRLAFRHAAHLPLHRVYELKSGGASSILREDAGAVAELIFGMVYNPAKAIIQLIGVLFILAVVDWTMLLGGDHPLPIGIPDPPNLD